MTLDYYKGKSVLITGGSSGIGFVIARQLVSYGAKVSILARDEQKLLEAKTELDKGLTASGQPVCILSADVSQAEKLAVVLGNHLSAHGTPDILINAAGVARPGYVEEIPLEVFQWTMDIDYQGTANMVKLLLLSFIARGSGHIVNFSSLAGVVGVYGYSAYSGAKFAVKGFSDVLRAELKPKGIRVSVVFPPDTDTPQLAWENQYKPFETSHIAGSDKPMSAEKVAQVVLKDAAKGKYAIVPGFEAKLMYFLATRMGNWVHPIMDIMVKNAINKKP